MVILHGKLYEKNLCLRLSDVVFIPDDEDEDQYGVAPGYALEIITCMDGSYYEFALFETTDGKSPLELARIVLDALQFIDSFEAEKIIEAVRYIAVRTDILERQEDEPHIKMDFVMDNNNLKYVFEVGDVDTEQYCKGYSYHKLLFETIMDTVRTLVAPLNLGL